MGGNRPYRALKNLTMLTQLGISLLTPIALVLWRCNRLRLRFGLGNWILIFGILFGLGSGIMSVYRYMKVFLRDAQRAQKEYEDKFR